MPSVNRSQQTEYVSTQLLVRSASLVRLLAKQLHGPLSRSEASLLNTASGTPRRITELADLEGLAQPTTTLLVKRLEQHGLVTRERQADDGRVVLVKLTEAGIAALEDYRAQASATLGKYLTEMPDHQIEELAAATKTLAQLVTVLQQNRHVVGDAPQSAAGDETQPTAAALDREQPPPPKTRTEAAWPAATR